MVIQYITLLRLRFFFFPLPLPAFFDLATDPVLSTRRFLRKKTTSHVPLRVAGFEDGGLGLFSLVVGPYVQPFPTWEASVAEPREREIGPGHYDGVRHRYVG